MIRQPFIRLLSLAAAATVAIGVVSYPYDFWWSFGDNSLTTTRYGADFHFYDGKLALYLNCRLPCLRRSPPQLGDPQLIERYEFLDNIFDVQTTSCALHAPGCTVQYNTLLWITLWIPLACFLCPIGTLMLVGRLQGRRRGKRGLCRSCGYSLYGLMEPRCPECGRAIPPEVAASIQTPPAVLDGDWSGRERWMGRGVAVIFTLILIATGAVAIPFVLKQGTSSQVPVDPGRRAYRLVLSSHRLCTACGIADPGKIDSLIDRATGGWLPMDRGLLLEVIDARRDPPRREDPAGTCGQCADAILAAAAASPPPSDVPVRFNPPIYTSPPFIENPRVPVNSFPWLDGRVLPAEGGREGLGPFPSSDNAVGPEPDG